MSASIKKNQKGYSLVELNISIVLLTMVALMIIVVFSNYFSLLTRSGATLDMTVDAQRLLRIVTEELRYGAGVRVTNTITDPNSPSGGWNTNNDAFVIITAVPALDSSNEYIINPDTGKPFLNELVYYKLGDVMHKRTLANQNASGNTFRTSCPADLASASCPADTRLIDNVDSMNFVLFDQDNASTNDPLLARSIVINLTLEKDTIGQPITLSNSVRSTLRNQF